MYLVEMIAKSSAVASRQAPDTAVGLREYIWVCGVNDRRFEVTHLGQNRFIVKTSNRRLAELIHQKVQRVFHVDPVRTEGFERTRIRV
ncbi:hypothetical protein KBC99_03085 [Candidatus Saccharibacteria bacterium]|nr:hypothetical protein [Candidatus Saccharibacteria bacterium]